MLRPASLLRKRIRRRARKVIRLNKEWEGDQHLRCKDLRTIPTIWQASGTRGGATAGIVTTGRARSLLAGARGNSSWQRPLMVASILYSKQTIRASERAVLRP